MLENEFFVKGDGNPNGTSTETGKVKMDLTGTGIAIGDIEKVVSGETDIPFTISGNVVTLTNPPQGENDFIFETEACDYMAHATIYTFAISNKNAFMAFYNNHSNRKCLIKH